MDLGKVLCTKMNSTLAEPECASLHPISTLHREIPPHHSAASQNISVHVKYE